ncbi:MAG: DUF1501 domain-containing protein [Verrucomicrobiota bacterium]|nr:DUF1501 domain-containing protein [Verrucomicrobiota bacterium]
MNPHSLLQQTRRHFFSDCGIGLGKIALATLLSRQGLGAAQAPDFMQHPVKAKRVIFLFMAGAPSQLELFDHKPKLREIEGSPIPPSVIQGQRYAFIQPDAAVLGPRFPFARHGQSGAELSDRLPHLSKVVDELAFVKSMHTDHFNHAPAQLFMTTGSGIPGRASMGSWLSYGIGSETDDLPAFVVLKSGGSLSGGASMWGSGFLPSEHQGVPFREGNDPILHLSNPKGIDDLAQRQTLDALEHLNRIQHRNVGDPEIRTRIEAYEMAYRMQSRAPELMDFSQESEATKKLYGIEDGKSNFASHCLLARRLVERGTRFVQLYHSGWDAHSNVEGNVKSNALAVDQGSAALIADLKQRGMLEDTIVVWGGEFGRTPMVEASAALGRSNGRDHHPQAFTTWLAGGGIKPGMTLGKTDDLGFHVTEDPVHVQDLQATILHLMGIEHTKLAFNFQGLDFRLTGVEEHHAIKKLMA